MRHLLDSDWLIDALVGVPSTLANIDELGRHLVGVSIVSHGELLEGAYAHLDPASELVRYRVFLSRFPMLPLTGSIMERFGKLRYDLRRQGQLIPDLDLLIAATAIDHDLALATRNLRHFVRVPDLEIVRLA